MQQHFNEAEKPVKLREKSDSCAKHFATQFHDTNPSATNQHGGTTCSIIGQGDPISAAKTSLPKTAPCVSKRDLQFQNNPDPTHNFLSTPTTKSAVPADTDHVSTGL